MVGFGVVGVGTFDSLVVFTMFVGQSNDVGLYRPDFPRYTFVRKRPAVLLLLVKLQRYLRKSQ